MNPRLAIHELSGALNLTRQQRLALEDIAGLDGQTTEPEKLPRVTALPAPPSSASASFSGWLPTGRTWGG